MHLRNLERQRCTDVMFKLAFYCLSVTAEDLNLQRRHRYEDINILGTRYFILLDTTSGARHERAPNFPE